MKTHQSISMEFGETTKHRKNNREEKKQILQNRTDLEKSSEAKKKAKLWGDSS